jgi:hypothetical protein
MAITDKIIEINWGMGDTLGWTGKFDVHPYLGETDVTHTNDSVHTTAATADKYYDAFRSSFDKQKAREKEKRPFLKRKCSRSSRTSFMIAGKTFSQYLERRLLVDNLGFRPANDMREASTDCGTIITAIVPQNPIEFLAYLHELGHVKSKQYERSHSGMFFGGVCDATVENEYNAWVWALKYFKRLGFTLCNSGKAVVDKAFSSYTDKSSNRELVSQLWNNLYEKFDVQGSLSKKKYFNPVFESTYNFDVGNNVWTDIPSKPFRSKSREVVKTQGWKELKEKQTKKAWKNQR